MVKPSPRAPWAAALLILVSPLVHGQGMAADLGPLLKAFFEADLPPPARPRSRPSAPRLKARGTSSGGSARDGVIRPTPPRDGRSSRTPALTARFGPTTSTSPRGTTRPGSIRRSCSCMVESAGPTSCRRRC